MVHGGSANTVLRFHATVCGTNQGAEFLQGGVDRQNALRLYRQGNGILVSLTEFPRQPRYTIKWANIAPLHPHPFDFEVWHARAITAAWMYDKGPRSGCGSILARCKTVASRVHVVLRLLREVNGCPYGTERVLAAIAKTRLKCSLTQQKYKLKPGPLAPADDVNITGMAHYLREEQGSATNNYWKELNDTMASATERHFSSWTQGAEPLLMLGDELERFEEACPWTVGAMGGMCNSAWYERITRDDAARAALRGGGY